MKHLRMLVLLALVVAGIFFGYMADEERSGRRIYWAEWPLPEAGGASPAGEPSRKPEDRKAA